MKRAFYAGIALALPPALIALAPMQAAAQERLQTIPLTGEETPTWLFSDYLPFSSSAGTTLQGLLSHTAARDLMIAAMFAICLAMVFAASYLFRENVNHLKADAERRQRKDLDGF